MYNGNAKMKVNAPAEELLPGNSFGLPSNAANYFTFSITATSPLIAPQ
jgi:hypothetical protein